MKKIILSLLLCATLTATAQERNMEPAQLAEKLFGYVEKNQTDSLYLYLTRQMKIIMSKEQMDGIMSKAEEKFGKYKEHGPWTVKEVSGSKTCTADVTFEKGQMAALVILDPSNFLIALQIVPGTAVSK